MHSRAPRLLPSLPCGCTQAVPADSRRRLLEHPWGAALAAGLGIDTREPCQRLLWVTGLVWSRGRSAHDWVSGLGAARCRRHQSQQPRLAAQCLFPRTVQWQARQPNPCLALHEPSSSIRINSCPAPPPAGQPARGAAVGARARALARAAPHLHRAAQCVHAVVGGERGPHRAAHPLLPGPPGGGAAARWRLGRQAAEPAGEKACRVEGGRMGRLQEALTFA